MKRMKIMLLSFVLLTIVGGALAFKAKTLTAYCTALTESDGTCVLQNGANKACPGNNNAPIQLTIGDGSTRFTYCYTTPTPGRSDCKQAGGSLDVLCISTSTTFKNNGD